MTQLKPVQIEALRRSEGKEGYIFGLDPGLGKTLTALVEFQRLRAAGKINRLLVICPNSVVGTWHNEIFKHGIDIAPLDLMVINYEAVIFSGGPKVLLFVRKQKVMLICDESHRIKNFQSQTTRWITNNLMLKVKYVRLLTGTPLAENPMDLFPQIRLCGGTMGVNPYAWRNKFCERGGWKGKQIVDVKDPEKLARACAPYIFRATKQDWAKDLPERTFTHLSVPMTPKQAQIYKEVRETYCSEWEGVEITATMAMSAMAKMQQISAGFVKNDDGEQVPIGKFNPKVQAALEWAQQFGQKNKFVIVATNIWVVQAVYQKLTDAGLNALALFGDADASFAEFQFNTNDEIDGAVISIKKGGVGLTLLGSEKRPCADMLHIQQSWSYIERQQANDRIHRIGQHHPCTYTDILSSPLEHAIVASLQRKRDASENVLRFLHGFDDDGMCVVGGADVSRDPAIDALREYPGLPGAAEDDYHSAGAS